MTSSMLRLAVLLSSVISMALGQEAFLVLFTGIHSEGTSVELKEDIPYLDEVGMDDLSQSICGVGLWFLYEKADYDVTSQFVHTFYASAERCETLDTIMRKKVSSVRRAGGPDTNEDILTIYTEKESCGFGQEYTEDTSSLGIFDNLMSSFAIVGNTGWTFYEDEEFTTNGICVEPLESGGFYYGFWNAIDAAITDKQVSSVKKGCFHDEMVKFNFTQV